MRKMKERKARRGERHGGGGGGSNQRERVISEAKKASREAKTKLREKERESE